MATIKIKRGSGQPNLSGLTAYEPAWDTTFNRLFIHAGTTAMWIGSQVVDDTSLAGNCAYFIPSQRAVKTYVDSQVAGGAVSSLNGSTGAVTIGGGTAISIATSTAARGITVTNTGVWSVNGTTGAVTNIAVTNASQTFTGVQIFSNGICAAGGTFTGTQTFINGATLQSVITIPSGSTLTVNGNFVANGNVNLGDAVTDSITVAGLLVANGGLSAAGGTFSGTQTFINGATFNAITNFLGGLCASNINVSGGLTLNGNAVTTTANTVTSFNGLIGAVTGVTTGVANTFGPLQTFSNGISVSGGTFSGTQTFVNGATFNAVANFLGGLCASNVIISGGLTLNGNAVTTTANTVTGITGTVNQITVSGNTGSVTLSLPSAITTPGSMTVSTDLTVTGNLTVNGTTTTVNSTSVTVQDPLIAIGGLTGNIPPVAGDVKDRGILFQYFDAVGRTGFFGHDTGTGRFTYIPIVTSVSGEVVTGPAGIAEFSSVRAPNQTLTLVGVSAANAQITLNGAATAAATSIANTAYETLITSSTGIGRLAIQGDLLDPTLKGTITTSAFTAARTFTLPDITGTLPVATTGGATSGWVLRGQGASTVNTWIDPTASGFTAFTTTNINLVGVKDSQNYGLVFALGTAGNQVLYGDSTTGVMWRPSTNTLTVGAGLGFFEGIIEGGTF